jgi:glycosyltransferase involved in cell wall biosynthesis
LPQCFGPGAAENHATWLKVVAQADAAVAISGAVAADLERWLEETGAGPTRPVVRSVPLGADLTHALPTRGLPADAAGQLEAIRRRPAFLMVGTVEPRKAHQQVLDAFERLWRDGEDVTLVVCGRRGWMVEKFAARLARHHELDQRLFWIEDASDEYLDKIYEACVCVIAASLGEGFGLPLVEAARHGVPVIARDIPVFREVAGEGAVYFSGDAPELAAAVRLWLAQRSRGAVPPSSAMGWLTWAESASRLRAVLGELAMIRQS